MCATMPGKIVQLTYLITLSKYVTEFRVSLYYTILMIELFLHIIFLEAQILINYISLLRKKTV